ncbi:MAG: hypothetical protein QOF99_1173 [Pseudonocardiales bacterium]|jgi:uncharacterized protein YkwD|nr:hypothetical protein [Pseudonocardiales bacterium]
MALSECTLRSLLRSPTVTTIGRRHLVPALAGLGCGALIAVVTVMVGPHQQPVPPQPDPTTLAGPMIIGPPPPDPAGTPDQGSPLLLPLPPPVPVPPPAPTPPPVPVPPPLPVPPVLSGPAGQVLAITNVQRRAAGCGPLKVDPRLMRAAQRHSQDMATRGYFSHTTPNGTGWDAREISAGYPEDKTGGENIAYGQATAAIVMNVWMHSPPHRQNILSCEFTTIGIGYYPPGHYWTQDFGY